MYFLILQLVIFIKTCQCIDMLCPVSEDGHPVSYPHPTDCSMFYQCDAGGIPVLMSCPDGLFFDPSLNVCNWPDLVNCNSGTTTPSSCLDDKCSRDNCKPIRLYL